MKTWGTLEYLIFISPLIRCLNDGRNVMATDNCTLCSPLYAKGAIFSLEWCGELICIGIWTQHWCHVCHNVIAWYTLNIFVDTLRGMVYPCIIQTQQPILPPTCLEIRRESLFLGHNAHSTTMCTSCNYRRHASLEMHPTPWIWLQWRCSMHLPSLLHIVSTLGVSFQHFNGYNQ